MTWGGLRGAVGLALAMQVMLERAPKICPIGTDLKGIKQKDAERLLFYVSGVAFLTMIVNATTAPYLVNKLGITAAPAARQTLLRMFHQQLVNWSESGDNPPEVTDALRAMLHEAQEEIDHQAVSASGPKSSREAQKEAKNKGMRRTQTSVRLLSTEDGAQTNAQISTSLREQKDNLRAGCSPCIQIKITKQPFAPC
jgi:NhaP-type Na+/H+ or K+/H+ antiporter